MNEINIEDLENIVSYSDSYKFTHWKQYIKEAEAVYSYYESRMGGTFSETVWFGLQAILKKHFVGQVVTRERIEATSSLCAAHFGSSKKFNREGWEYILNEFDGYLPLRIKAVPEGTPVTLNNVLMTVENLGGEKTKWLTGYCETILTHVWYSSVVATLSRHVKVTISHYLDLSCDYSKEIKGAILNFMLHDFGYRGVSSNESAGMGGMAHLVNFLGTDTFIGMIYAMKYYSASMYGLGYSVDATEHSVMTQLGPDGESKILDNILEDNKEGIVSVVADSYNIERFINEYVRERKEQILGRQPNAIGLCKFVVRPDSLRYKYDTPEEQMVWIFDTLWDIFGGSVNTFGKKMLNPKVGALWGDGIDAGGIEKILNAIVNAGYSVESLVFGMGGGLLQKVNRDTQRSAFKCSAQSRGGQWVDIQKNPLDLTKVSKAGRLALIKGDKDGLFHTVREEAISDKDNCLKLVFENGKLITEYSFNQVRVNASL